MIENCYSSLHQPLDDDTHRRRSIEFASDDLFRAQGETADNLHERRNINVSLFCLVGSDAKCNARKVLMKQKKFVFGPDSPGIEPDPGRPFDCPVVRKLKLQQGRPVVLHFASQLRPAICG